MLAGYSGRTLKLLQSSWTQGTVKQYKTYLDRWEEYCFKKGIDPLNAPVAAGVEFLSDLFHDTNVQYSALNTARSALSTVIPEKDGLTFGKQPIVKRLMKGIFKERPSLPKYTIVYDVDIVLNYMISLPKPEDVGLKELSIRIATLLCILSGQRSQTISRLTITFIRPSDTKIILLLVFIKNL